MITILLHSIRDFPYSCCVRRPFSHRALGFTLVEVLLVVVAISLITTAGYFTVVAVRDSARESKLQSDVKTLNASVQSYLANGGSLPSDTTAQGVLSKLKTRASATSAVKAMGLTGSFIDDRIEPVWQNAAEGASSQPRAVWNVTQQRFVLLQGGSTGIKEFRLNNALAGQTPAKEDRSTSLAAGTDSQWVWNYADNTNSTADPGAAPGTNPGAGYIDPSAASAGQLSPPIFSPQGGTQPLSSFDMSVTLSNPNAAGTSQIYYSIASSPLALYRGNPITVTPGLQISAYAKSVDPDHWSDSNVDTETYSVSPLALTVSVSVASPVTYAMVSSGSVTVTISLSNLSQIPAQYRTGLNVTYQVGISGAAQTITASPFSRSFALSTTDFASATGGLTISATAAPTTSTYFTAGNGSATVAISKTPLPLLITPASGQIAATDTITVAPDPSASFPAGYKIYYTTDGSAPSRSSTLYSTPFAIPAGSTLSVQAAAFPSSPADDQWFSNPIAIGGPYSVPSPGSLAGVIVSKIDKLNGVINGSVQLLTISDFQWNGSTILNGDLYLAGSPVITGNLVANSGSNSLTVYSGTSTSSPRYLYSTYNGKKAFVPPSGSPTYTFNIDAGTISGRIFTKTNSTTDGLSSLDASYLSTVMSGTSTVPAIPTNSDNRTLNGNTTLTLPGGTYGTISVNGTLNLGVTGGATTYYNINSIVVNGSGQIVLKGPVVIFLKNGGTLNNIVGTTSNNDWLTVYSQGALTVNGGGGIFGKKIVTTSSIDINGKVTLTEGTIAKSVTVEGGGSLNVGKFTETP